MRIPTDPNYSRGSYRMLSKAEFIDLLKDSWFFIFLILYVFSGFLILTYGFGG